MVEYVVSMLHIRSTQLEVETDTDAKKIGMREKHSKVATSRRHSLRASFITSIIKSREKLGIAAFCCCSGTLSIAAPMEQ